MSEVAKVYSLVDNQMKAVQPDETVWLSASAGTGKTQVLSSRVLRLLLQPDVEPSQILCLTFTKAGATEMAERINGTLAEWVRLPETQLFQRLEAIGAATDDATKARARTLFASVLDCPGGGLRINTIHAFAQWLLGAFPHEANLTPGTRAMEDRDRVLLQRQVLSDLLIDAKVGGRQDLLDAVANLSIRMGPEDVEAYLMRCAAARELWTGNTGWIPPLRPRLNQLLGLNADADMGQVAALCDDDAFDVDSLQCCLSAYQQWNGVKGQAGRVVIADWLAASAEDRLASFDKLFAVLFTQKDTVKDTKSLVKFEEHFGEAAECVLAEMRAIRELRGLVALAEWLAPALTLGHAFSEAWEKAKAREGLIDFDDQIRQAAELLTNSDLSEWIRYKLDRRFDHILVDEAQDTNEAQWNIIKALTGDFFTGMGAKGDMMRTLFVVGDYKQAIFRFQGTSPENFKAAQDRVEAEMLGAAQNAEGLRSNVAAKELLKLGLDESFRTAQPVLEFVNKAIAHIGHEAFGLDKAPDDHVGDKTRPGYVALWRPVGMDVEGDSDDSDSDAYGDASDDADSEKGAEDWLSKPERQLADRIARQVKSWIDGGFPLLKGKARRATAGDVMVLVRKRGELAALIVARLHAAGVAVAGVDRLRLGAPLAVRDLLAALRFAAQPLDDLNLASLLVSPLIGWTQEQLLEHGHRDKHVPLWSHLRRISHPDVAAAMDQLTGLLRIADYEPPQALLHWLLVGPWGGRRRLVARLGREANDPIDELLNAAHAYAMSATPSLGGFLRWFDAGKGELKREAGQAGDMVRVMTVHGAKGLQAPIVILADATSDPKPKTITISLDEPLSGKSVPMPSLKKEDRSGRFAEAHDRALQEEGEEHWRLLYVAMTRAEEALFVGGALKPSKKGIVPDGSWYAKLRELFGADDWLDDPIWGANGRLEHGDPPLIVPMEPKPAEAPRDESDPLPQWLTTSLAAEPRPPRPLAPSSLGEETAADPPLPPGAGLEAARRGVLVHRLLERLPEVLADARRDAALRWLAKTAGDLSEAAHSDIAEAALNVLTQPQWAALFGPGSLAEVPIAALVGERVVAGTIDRLLVEPERVRIVDYKTARRPPAGLEQVPLAYLKQMAAYAAALEVTFPGRVIEAALLYTHAPHLIAIPADVLALHKPELSYHEESLSP